MEPLTTALLTTIAAAAGTLAGGATEAAGSDAWQAARRKLEALARLDERRRAAAFDIAVGSARRELRRLMPNTPAAEHVLTLLLDDPVLRRVAVEELLLSARPNLGRLLDHYRRELRFTALLRGVELPPWHEAEPALRQFFAELLPRAMAEQRDLRPLLLEQAELAALDTARTHAPTRDGEPLARIEALLRELLTLPQIAQTIEAEGSTLTEVKQFVVQGNYYEVPNVPAPDLDALYRRYRTFLSETFGTLDFRGILQMQNVMRLPLDEVYIPLNARRTGRGAREVAPRFDQAMRPDERIHHDGERLTLDGAGDLHDLVRDTPFLVVLGDPGAGKSTLVRAIVLALAEGRAGAQFGLDGEWLPILFPVAAFAEARERDGDLAPLEYAAAYYRGLSQPDYGPLLHRALLAGRALVLLDGLDEVRERRLELVKCLEAFVREWDVPGNRFLATSRIAGYEDAPLDDRLFPQAIVQPFDDDDIRLFARRWSIAFERAGAPARIEDHDAAAAELQRRAEARAKSLSDAIFGADNITALARNPLLLTILALIHNQGTRLPDRRIDLYRLCVEALAETWNHARSLTGREINIFLGDQKLDERFVINVLGPAALWVHEEQPGGLVEQGDLRRQITATLRRTYGLVQGKAQALADDFIELVRRHTGLLQERGHRRYGFLHLTFEEYLAARALLESEMVDDPDAMIQLRATDPGWREVLRLALASASLREASRLALLILDTPTAAATHGRPAILAGECLLDIGRSGVSQTAWQRVTAALVALLDNRAIPYAIRIEAGHVLGRLGDPRLLDPAIGNSADGAYWCEVAAGSFWSGNDTEEELQLVELDHDFRIARFTVTNAEFQCFIEDGGYDPQSDWWSDEGRKFLAPGGHRYDDQSQPITLPRLWHDSEFNSPSQPVVGVSWYEAVAYCNWLTVRGHLAGWLPKSDVIRLPTWREWERAARGTDQRRYSWGGEPPTPEHANYEENQLGAPAPVGCFPAGVAPCGASDMIGNVCEWTVSPYRDPESSVLVQDLSQDDGAIISWTHYGSDKERLCCGSRYVYNPYIRIIVVLGIRVIWSRALVT